MFKGNKVECHNVSRLLTNLRHTANIRFMVFHILFYTYILVENKLFFIYKSLEYIE